MAGIVEEIISNGVSEGVRNAAGQMVSGNASNETVESVNTILTTAIPRENPLSDASWIIFMVAVVLILLYSFLFIFFFKRKLKEEVKTRYISMESSSRGPGLILVSLGEMLYISSNGIIISIVTVLAAGVMVNSIFPSTMSIMAIGILGWPLLVAYIFAIFFLLLSFYIYATYVTVGLVTMRTIGLVLFIDPNNIMAKKLLRVFLANQLFPLLLVLVIWFTELTALIFVLPVILSPFAPIFVSLFSCILLYVLHTLAWDWDRSVSIARYNRNITVIKKTITLGAAACTGNPKVIATAAAASATSPEQPPEEHQHGIKMR